MRVLVLHHVPHQPNVIKRWGDENNHALSFFSCAERNDYPGTSEFDAFIIMGGPMGVNDSLPWLASETQYIQQLVSLNKPVLGICLGAQLIAKALGAEVFSMATREIGWHPVNKTEQPHWLHQCLPQVFSPFHWHGDNFEIPEGASHLYSSEGCENQAFAVGDNIVGLQFHLDFDTCTTMRVAENSPQELAGCEPFVQPLPSMLAKPERFCESNRHLFSVLNRLCG